MNIIWLKVIAVMFGAVILKYVFGYPEAKVIIDLLALAVCYPILKNTWYLDLRRSMLYLSGFTLLNILVDLRVISPLSASIVSLLVIIWLLWKKTGHSKPSQPLRHKWHK